MKTCELREQKQRVTERGTTARANALGNAFAMYDGGRRGLPMYDVRLRCSRALRGGCGANANGMSWSRRRRNAAYVRCTMYDLLIMCALRRFFFGSLMYAEIPLEPSSCRPPVVMIFDAYKRGYQSIRLLSLLITFSQMRLP